MSTIDDRRERVALETAYQVDYLLRALLPTFSDIEEGPLLRSVFLRVLDLTSVVMRVFDEDDDDIADMERIVFGQAKEVEQAE